MQFERKLYSASVGGWPFKPGFRLSGNDPGGGRLRTQPLLGHCGPRGYHWKYDARDVAGIVVDADVPHLHCGCYDFRFSCLQVAGKMRHECARHLHADAMSFAKEIRSE